MGGQRFAPGFVEAAVDHLEQRPDHGVRRPRIVVGGAGDLRDQRARIAERDPGADAVLSGAAAEDVAEPLTQPAFDTLGGDDYQFCGEGVGQGSGQQLAEAVGEEVGARCTVKVKAIEVN
jgi:hypothetical protein